MTASRYKHIVVYDDNSTEWIASQDLYKILDEYGSIKKEDGSWKSIVSIIRTELYEQDWDDHVTKVTTWND